MDNIVKSMNQAAINLALLSMRYRHGRWALLAIALTCLIFSIDIFLTSTGLPSLVNVILVLAIIAFGCISYHAAFPPKE